MFGTREAGLPDSGDSETEVECKEICDEEN